jgi:hypothetical protein
VDNPKLHQVGSTPQSIIVTGWLRLFSSKLTSGRAEAEKLAAQDTGSTTMRLIGNSVTQQNREITGFCPSFRYAPAARLLYLSHMRGVDIFCPAPGNLFCRLGTRNNKGEIGLVDAKGRGDSCANRGWERLWTSAPRAG